MPILRLADVHLAYGHHPLLDGADLVLERRERVALVGRNGTGKSTLLKLLSGAIQPDGGERWVEDGVRIAYLRQEVPADETRTVAEVVAEGLGAVEAWERDYRVAAIIDAMTLPGDRPMAACSGGIRRRALLAQALVGEPDLLLLDEPTNHLDIEAITALEDAVLGFRGAVVFVTHDRALIERLAERIIELDRGRLTNFPGDYATYLRRKAAMLADEARADAQFDKELAAEEAWIREGIKARRTRNEGRVRRLEQMRRERSARIGPKGQVQLAVARGDQSGALVAELEDVSFARDVPIVSHLSLRVVRGDRIGIIGPNGCGKTTLLRILLGQLAPDSGRVKVGTRLAVAYFDQQREQLRLEESVRDNVVEGSDTIRIGDKSRHVIGYLGDFLFEPARCNSPVKSLSGGERARLLLARLFSKPANVLVLDEPTNDLDVETLELLEELLTDYDGTVLLVSHDRAFLDSVVTSTLVFEREGRWQEYVGGYSDWVRQRPAPSRSDRAPRDGGKSGMSSGDSRAAAKRTTDSSDAGAEPAGTGRDKPRQRARLSYRETQELAALPQRIETLEARQGELQAAVSDSAFYQQPEDKVAAGLAELAALDAELEAAYARWEALEALAE